MYLQHFKKEWLLQFPEEVKLRILALAVTEDDPIQPRQLKSKSNKFIWSKLQVNRDGTININAVGPLTAVTLAKVCKQLYIDVGLGHLLYSSNTFDFTHLQNHAVITYMVATTEERLKAVTSIKMNISGSNHVSLNDW